MKILRKIRKRYHAPTPKTWRKVGDTLLVISTMGVPAVLMNHAWIGMTLFIVGILGKFLTNFFTEE